MADDAWILSEYDGSVTAAGTDGIKVGDACAEVALRFARAIESGEISLTPAEIATAQVRQVVTKARSGRKATWHRELSHIVAALRDETILGRTDPRLWQAFPLGDGRDKALALWSIDDWKRASDVHRVKANEAIAAAQIIAEQVSIITSAMFAADAEITRDLFPDAGHSAA